MATHPTVKLPNVELPSGDVVAGSPLVDAAIDLADAELRITKKAFAQRYEQGLSSLFQECAPSEVDALLADRMAALMLEGARRGLLRAVARSAIYTAVLVSVCFLVRLPAKAICFIVPVAFVSGVCLSKRS